MKILDFLDENLIEIDLQAIDKRGIIEEMVSLMIRAGKIRGQDEVVEIFMKREDMVSTGIGHGVAIPQGRVGEVSQTVGTFGRSMSGIDFKALDSQPVHLFFMLVTPKDGVNMHLRCLARVSRFLRDEDFRRRLREATTKKEVMEIFVEGDEKLH